MNRSPRLFVVHTSSKKLFVENARFLFTQHEADHAALGDAQSSPAFVCEEFFQQPISVSTQQHL